MANAVFTSKLGSPYDDLPEIRYHFPKRYLGQVEQAVGDWIVYYEPRREGSSSSSSSGRQQYVAIARVKNVTPDTNKKEEYFYAHMSDYLEFTSPVSFKTDEEYLESSLKKSDGSTNKGKFGWSVRGIPQTEFELICKLGFAEHVPSESTAFQEEASIVADEPAPYGRSDKKQLVERPFREAAFKQVIQRAYSRTCAMTGMSLVNGGGRCEIEAAHIRPVEDDGPDSPRNGIALSRTVHWMFDRGIFSISEKGEILIAKKHAPDQVLRMLNPDLHIRLPSNPLWTPHATFLQFHRDHKFKGH